VLFDIELSNPSLNSCKGSEGSTKAIARYILNMCALRHTADDDESVQSQSITTTSSGVLECVVDASEESGFGALGSVDGGEGGINLSTFCDAARNEREFGDGRKS
jgi:hypothetical protein